MNKREAKRLALQRMINVAQGDMQIGGFWNFLLEEEYSDDDILKFEKAYREVIADLDAKLERMASHA